MTKQDKKILLQGFVAVVVITILSLLAGTADGAQISRSGRTLNGVPFKVWLQSNGSFDRVDLGGETDIARAAHWPSGGMVVEGYCYRSKYSDARAEILRAILPDTTKQIGTLRRQCYVYAEAYWECEKAKKQTNDKQEVADYTRQQRELSDKIAKAEAAIYDLLPAIVAKLNRGDLEAELRQNGADHEFAARILNGAVRSVKKVNNNYKPTDEADSER